MRYALIYAVFVKPIQIQIFHIPSDAFRIPRQIKLADPRGPFHLQLRERLEKVASESINNDKKFKGKKTADNTREKEIINDLDIEIPPTPRSSLNEEETLANYRRFILPLIESNEAMQIFEMHAGNM